MPDKHTHTRVVVVRCFVAFDFNSFRSTFGTILNSVGQVSGQKRDFGIFCYWVYCGCSGRVVRNVRVGNCVIRETEKNKIMTCVCDSSISVGSTNLCFCPCRPLDSLCSRKNTFHAKSPNYALCDK